MNREDVEFYHWIKFNVSNQGKPVKISQSGRLDGRIGIYTGCCEYYDESAWVRVGTNYHEIDVRELKFVPNGKMTELIYGT